jgi:acetyltransferase-like isoleucine patch superfamily enzyme
MRNLIWQKVFGINRAAYWPTHYSSRIDGANYVHIGIGTAPGLSIGCYIFAKSDSPIFIGDYTIVASNVCIAGFSHDLYDYSSYPSKGGVKIGKYCWLAANSVVLPGVELGDHTIVGAGSVVTKSFSEGYVVLGGNPARVIKRLKREQVVRRTNSYEYRGYIREDRFDKFRARRLEN